MYCAVDVDADLDDVGSKTDVDSTILAVVGRLQLGYGSRHLGGTYPAGQLEGIADVAHHRARPSGFRIDRLRRVGKAAPADLTNPLWYVALEKGQRVAELTQRIEEHQQGPPRVPSVAFIQQPRCLQQCCRDTDIGCQAGGIGCRANSGVHPAS
jgi:hypothetical protein